MNRLAKLCYAVLCAAVAVLAVTGIGVYLRGQSPMTHWVLMIHMTAAPMFALGLAGVAVTWADMCRQHSRPCLCGAAKVLFWLISLTGLVVILSGVLPMLPLFGSVGQHLLYLTHRYAGIVLTCALVCHIPALCVKTHK